MTNPIHQKIQTELAQIDAVNLKYVRELRNNPTEAERKLWYFLRRKQFSNVKFRRKFPIDAYIVDFVSFKAKLIIEADGGDHNLPENIEYDKIRTIKLEKLGFKVLRFWNHEILHDIEIVLETIYQFINNSE